MRKSGAPILLLLAIGVFVMLGIQFGNLVVKYIQEDKFLSSIYQKKETPSRRTFEDLNQIHPKQKILQERLKQRVPKPFTVPMTIAPHNLVEGPFDAKVTLTIFNDPSCIRCDLQVDQVLRSLNTAKIKVVYKFFPMNADNYRGGDQEGGIFQQLAMKYGVWSQLKEKLLRRQNQIDANEWADLFEEVGISLSQLRKDLRRESPIIMRNLERDRALAQKALIVSIPAFFINEYYIDGQMLRLEDLPRSIARLQANQPILRPQDLPTLRSVLY